MRSQSLNRCFETHQRTVDDLVSITGNILSVCGSYASPIRVLSIYTLWLPYLLPTGLFFDLSRYATMSVEKSTNSLDKQATATETEHVEVLPMESPHGEKYDNHGATDLETGDGGAYSTVSLYHSVVPQLRLV